MRMLFWLMEHITLWVFRLMVKPLCRLMLWWARKECTPEGLHEVQRLVAQLTPLLW